MEESKRRAKKCLRTTICACLERATIHYNALVTQAITVFLIRSFPVIDDEDKPEEASQLLQLTRRPTPGPLHIVFKDMIGTT